MRRRRIGHRRSLAPDTHGDNLAMFGFEAADAVAAALLAAVEAWAAVRGRAASAGRSTRR
jgi:hypothetical protein